MSDSNKGPFNIINGTFSAVIEVREGFTLPQVLALMNDRSARIEGGAVVAYPEMGEGCYTIAQVFSHHNGARWGDGWKESDGTADDTTQYPDPDAAEDEEESCAGGGCCNISPEERDRNFANGIRVRADRFTEAGNYEAAASLISAAWTLLDNSGGRDNEPGIWLLASEANILQRQRENLGVAEQKLLAALALSERLFGDEHPCTAVCTANVADILSDAGKKDEARKYLARATALLLNAEPTGDYTAEYLTGVRAALAAIEL